MVIRPEEILCLLMEDYVEAGLPIESDFWPGMSIRQAAAVSLYKSIVQKWRYENTDETDKAALSKFLRNNSSCREWALPQLYDCKTEELLGCFKQALWDFWSRNGYPLIDSDLEVLDKARLGPGVNLGARGNDFYTKLFSSPLTCSDPKLYRWYKYYTARFPTWLDAENFRYTQFGQAQIVENSKLSFVPKNDKISRCICIEPTLNTFFQLGFGSHLEDRLSERFGIALDSQPFKNRELARLGSLTDGLSTIDLSSASDSISMNMLRAFLPADFLRWLERYRCKYVEVPGMGTQELHMVSTMGNGFTFPLQTAIFACVVTAVMRWRGIPADRGRPVKGKGFDPLKAKAYRGVEASHLWGVFGDDIICPASCTSDVVALLNLLGFTVNSDKTFVKGPFRESCGADFYLGTNIRGVYLKDLRDVTQRYSAINQLILFQTRTGISLARVIGRLLDSVPKLPVPLYENIDSGIRTPFRIARNDVKKHIETQGYEYLCYTPRLPRIRVDEDRIVVPRRNKSRVYNPSGLLYSFLQGSISAGAIGTRYGVMKYRKKRRVTSMWESRGYPHPGQEWQDVEGDGWNAVASSYLERGEEV